MGADGIWSNGRKASKVLLKKAGFDRYKIMKRVARHENAVAHIYGMLFLYMAIAMFFPYLAALYFNDDPRPWLFPLLLTALIGAPLVLRYKSPENTRPTEALFVVATAWFAVMVMGAIPFILYGMPTVDALFETMSGFTTTGSTIMTNIESWPRSLLFWRSFTQWLGGAGIIMIFVTILPILGVGGRTLFKNEFPGLNVQNFSLRIQEESRKFHYIYLGLSGLQFGLLALTGIGFYDSLLVMFSTMPTGGFSPHTESIAYYQSPVVEWIVIVFMFLAATNFYLHFRAIAERNIRTYWKSAEFRTFTIIVVGATFLILLLLWGKEFHGIEEGIRTSLFQVLSIVTSTGYATTDYALWSTGVLFVLMALMVIGGSTGSTAGGLKTARFLVSRKFVYASLYKTVHPRAIFYPKLDGRPIGQEAISSLMAVVICYIGTALVSTTLLILMGVDPITSMSGSVATLSNAGPGLGPIGPMGSFAALPDPAKLVLVFTMWAGRLEFLTVFVILTPVFWRELLRYREH